MKDTATSLLSEFEIITLKSGAKSLRSNLRNETFHPTSSPIGEATLLHVDQQKIIERSKAKKAAKFVIWDVGFGAAANALAIIKAMNDVTTPIEMHSFDKTTSPMEFTLLHAQELNYVLGYEEQLRTLLLKREVRIGNIDWKLHLGDFSESIKSSLLRVSPPNSILYDPYSAATNPEMWTLEHFKNLWNQLDPSVDCMLTNYTRSTAVRVGLLLAGFFVGDGCVIGEKAETTIASNQLSLLERPLTRRWLERVRNSTNSAPLRGYDYSKSKISDEYFVALEKLPQFNG